MGKVSAQEQLSPQIVCINGVKYYHSSDTWKGMNGVGYKMLAPYVNPETLKFEKCDVKKEVKKK